MSSHPTCPANSGSPSLSASSQQRLGIVVAMELTPLARRRARYLVPVGAAVITAAAVFVPQAASGAQHPDLPSRTAAELLASLEQADVAPFSGTVVETARLGLPNIGDSSLGSAVTPSGQAGLAQIMTLLTGSHTAQIAYGGPDKQRVAIFLSDLSETDIVHNGTDVWTYSSDSNTVTHSALKSGQENSQPDATTPVDPTKAAEQALAEIDPSTQVTVDRTAEVAGHAAYQLDLTPRDSRTLIGSVQIALDATTSMPLRVQIWSQNNTSAAAFSVGFTSISTSPPNASTFDFTVPPTSKTVPDPFTRSDTTSSADSAEPAQSQGGTKTLGQDWASVLMDQLDQPSDATAATGPSAHPQIAQELDKLGTSVAEGHLITTSLLTVLVTNDNRVLIGAVTPAYLQQLAASSAGQ